MTLDITTHLNFRGEARAALEFYQSIFGGQVIAFTYADMGDTQDPADGDLVKWGQAGGETGFRVMAYDVPAAQEFERGTNSFFVSLRFDSETEVRERWTALAEGATVLSDLAPAPWAPLYGMLRDKFGIVWILDVAAANEG